MASSSNSSVSLSAISLRVRCSLASLAIKIARMSSAYLSISSWGIAHGCDW